MDTAVKERWVRALRSGEYQQGTGQLRKEDKYCCLGVLTDLYDKRFRADGSGWRTDKWAPGSDYSETIYRTRDGYRYCSYPPPEVMRWAGLTDDDCSDSDLEEFGSSRPRVRWKDNYRMPLDELNDDGETFETIADLIEQQL